MKTIYVFLAEGFEEVEALTPVDVLRRAGLPVKTVSITGVLTVNGAHGVPVVADMVFEEVKEEDAEMIVLPGGLPGATNLDAHEGLGKLIMTFAEAGRPLSAICAAPLRGRRQRLGAFIEDEQIDGKPERAGKREPGQLAPAKHPHPLAAQHGIEHHGRDGATQEPERG